jgi:membrane protein required for beta-lactamase induction
MKLLAILLAFALLRWLEKPAALRSFSWVDQLHDWFKGFEFKLNQVFALTVLLPVFVLAVLMTTVFDFDTDSLLYLLVHVFIIYYCLGPETMQHLLNQSGNQETTEETHDVPSPQQFINAMTDAALHRWFGVFFWYAILNVYGAVLFRLVCHMQQASIEKDEDAIRSFSRLLEFPVAVLMTVSLALASDFDRIWKHCKQYLNGETIRTLNSQFMYQSMDYAVEQCEIDASGLNDTKVVEMTTYTVLKRMLVVWLVFAALMVIFSIG